MRQNDPSGLIEGAVMIVPKGKKKRLQSSGAWLLSIVNPRPPMTIETTQRREVSPGNFEAMRESQQMLKMT